MVVAGLIIDGHGISRFDGEGSFTESGGLGPRPLFGECQPH
jgi:hypothetical protein